MATYESNSETGSDHPISDDYRILHDLDSGKFVAIGERPSPPPLISSLTDDRITTEGDVHTLHNQDSGDSQDSLIHGTTPGETWTPEYLEEETTEQGWQEYKSRARKKKEKRQQQQEERNSLSQHAYGSSQNNITHGVRQPIAPRKKYIRLAFPHNVSPDTKFKWAEEAEKKLKLSRGDLIRATFSSPYVYISRSRPDVVKSMLEGKVAGVNLINKDNPERRKKMKEYLVKGFHKSFPLDLASSLDGVYKSRRLKKGGVSMNRIIIVWNREDEPPKEHYFPGMLGLPPCTIQPWETGPVMCYRCMDFNHVAQYCPNAPRCGLCAGPHELRSCPRKEPEAPPSPTTSHTKEPLPSNQSPPTPPLQKCARCHKEGVTGWHPDCEKRPPSSGRRCRNVRETETTAVATEQQNPIAWPTLGEDRVERLERQVADILRLLSDKSGVNLAGNSTAHNHNSAEATVNNESSVNEYAASVGPSHPVDNIEEIEQAGEVNVNSETPDMDKNSPSEETASAENETEEAGGAAGRGDPTAAQVAGGVVPPDSASPTTHVEAINFEEMMELTRDPNYVKKIPGVNWLKKMEKANLTIPEQRKCAHAFKYVQKYLREINELNDKYGC